MNWQTDKVFKINTLIKKAFTLIELLIIVAIIALLASAILVMVGQSRRNARLNSAKTALKSTLPAIIACKDGNGNVNNPVAGDAICSTNVGLNNAKWPILSYGYNYVAGGNYSVNCKFDISTNNDTATNLMTCDCVAQLCK